jgi:hypothetical protein
VAATCWGLATRLPGHANRVSNGFTHEWCSENMHALRGNTPAPVHISEAAPSRKVTQPTCVRLLSRYIWRGLCAGAHLLAGVEPPPRRLSHGKPSFSSTLISCVLLHVAVPSSQYHSVSTGEHCAPTTTEDTVLATEKASAFHPPGRRDGEVDAHTRHADARVVRVVQVKVGPPGGCGPELEGKKMWKGCAGGVCASCTLKPPMTSHHTRCSGEMLGCSHITLGLQHSTVPEAGWLHPSLRNSSPLRSRPARG